MTESATADLVAQGIEAAQVGNRLLARLHFERAAKTEPVQPLIWVWLAWLADSPSQAELHLRKIQTGPYAEFAASGLKWLSILSAAPESSTAPDSLVFASQTEKAAPAKPSAELPTGPVYSLKCPGCRGPLKIWGKIVGPLHRCPACKAVFVAEQDPQNPQKLTRRLLSSESQTPAELENCSNGDPEQPLILVLDNRISRRQLMLNVLRRAGYRVQPATDRAETLLLASQGLPQLILLDGNLPGLDGLEICRAIRSDPVTQHIPIVMLSNRTSFFDQVQAKLAGCTGYVTKPCEAEALLQQVQQVLQSDGPAERQSKCRAWASPMTTPDELALELPTAPKPAVAPHHTDRIADSDSNLGFDIVAAKQKLIGSDDDDAELLQDSIFG